MTKTKFTRDILNLPLFIYADYHDENGNIKDIHIQTSDMSSTQDCKIGSFSDNWWIRPAKAVKKIPYLTLSEYKKAIKLSLLKSQKIKVIDIYKLEKLETKDGNEDFKVYL